MTRALLIATILMAATACDKVKQLTAGRAGAAELPAAGATDLSTRPDVLYQVFGEREDPRMIPLATIDGGMLKPIVLDAAGWMRFDSLYQRSGARFPLYRDARTVGTVRVRQGMWERPDAPIYSLPNCELLTPLSAVTVDTRVPLGYTVEFLASTAQVGALTAGRTLPQSDVSRLGHEVGRAAAVQAGIDPALIESLDFAAQAIATGATTEPTLVVTFVDPLMEDHAGTDHPVTHLFIVADIGPDGRYAPTFTHAVNGPALRAQSRRFVDHLDVNRDAISEIVLEASQFDAGSYLVVLGYQNGRWAETFRSGSSWCLDSRR